MSISSPFTQKQHSRNVIPQRLKSIAGNRSKVDSDASSGGDSIRSASFDSKSSVGKQSTQVFPFVAIAERSEVAVGSLKRLALAWIHPTNKPTLLSDQQTAVLPRDIIRAPRMVLRIRSTLSFFYFSRVDCFLVTANLDFRSQDGTLFVAAEKSGR